MSSPGASRVGRGVQVCGSRHIPFICHACILDLNNEIGIGCGVCCIFTEIQFLDRREDVKVVGMKKHLVRAQVRPKIFS